MATAVRNTLMVQLSNGAVGRRCVHRCNLPLGSAEVVVSGVWLAGLSANSRFCSMQDLSVVAAITQMALKYSRSKSRP